MLDAGALPEAVRGQVSISTRRAENSGGIGCFTPDSFPVFDVFRDNVYVIADSNHGYKMLGVGKLVAGEIAGESSQLLEPFRFSRYERASSIRCRRARSHGADAFVGEHRKREECLGEKRMATDYEKFTKAPGRDELIKQVRKKIDALGIEYLYLQFVSVTGRIMGKGIPADHWENVANGGFQLVYGATVNLFLNRRGEYLGYGPEAAELVGVPEPETFMQLPWDKRVARMFCTLFRNREERENPGAFLTADCRGNLRRIHDQFENDHGLRLRHGTEPEMMWLKKDDNGNPNGGYSNPYCYHIDQFESLRPVYMRVIDYCRQDGPRHDPGRS